MGTRTSRRRILGAGALAAGGALLGSAAHAARTPFRRKSPAATDLIEVGIITCGYYSHIEDIWGRMINPIGKDESGVYWPRQTGMVMTMVWDPDPKAARTFADKYNVEVVADYADMVDRVDGVIFSDYYATGWWPQLTAPYLDAGMPCLINRPFALSMAEARAMIARSQKGKAPILVPSSDEYMMETIQARTRVQRLLQGGGHVTGVMAFEPCGEYPAHGVHSIYNIYTILEQPDVIAAGLIADTWWEWGDVGGLMSWRVRGRDGAPDYFVSIRMSSEPDTNGWLVVSTSKGRVYAPNDHEGEVFARYRNMFLPPLQEFERMIATGNMPQSHDYILAKTLTYLTGFYSHREAKGVLVPCAELPEDWRAPETMPDRIPASVFR